MKFLYCFVIILVFSRPEILAQEKEDGIPKTTDLTVDQIGLINRSYLLNGSFGQNFRTEYTSYNPSPIAVNGLKPLIYRVEITVVMATWCSDSQMQVPRFFKLLDLLDYNTSYIKIIQVDRKKRAGDIDISALGIDFIPTFFFYTHGKELGRIVESPVKSLEEDALEILLQ